MAKRKATPVKDPTLKVAPEIIGGRKLIVCSVCGGFGAVMLDDGDWKTCKPCGGGGRAWEEAKPKS